ncbi:MAG: anaerobic ribonucleoside-triphosphate reductase activating protein [Monoglobales bacterium]
MNIHGIQKLTLLDYPGKVACTIFTGGCNLRCPFCHNSPLVLPEKMIETPLNLKEIFSFLEKRKGLLDGICLTGGEPLLQSDINDFLKKVKSLGYSVKLDTNGFFPDKLKGLAADGVIDYVAMDIKNSEEKYAKTCGVDYVDISSVKESIAFLVSGNIPYEFRTTVVRELHDEDSFHGIAKLISGAENYYLQSYVRSYNVISDVFSDYPPEILETFAQIVRPFVNNVSVRGI